MPLDPQVRSLLDAAEKAGLQPLWQLTPDQARAQYRMRVQRMEAKNVPIHKVEELRIPGPDRPIGLRIYWPRERMIGETLPVLVWFHGGGFVIGSLDTHDTACRFLSNGADCIVISVDYRLAPEAKFPAAIDDSFAALRWVVFNGADLGIDIGRIAVGGDSAGGNLAAVCALMARDAGFPVRFQLLIYPCTAPEPETASHRAFADGYLLTRQTITWFYRHYLRSSKDTHDFRYAPLIADDLSSLPPAWLCVAGFDPLRDEGVQYATRLIEAGNRVTLVNYEGAVHGFFLMQGGLEIARRAIDDASAALRDGLKKTEET
ncbi:MAG: alpha/beta hydrolase [Burkholderiales bacterium]|nr:alpha/beta hydrolase [Burkholderiales bacterium]